MSLPPEPKWRPRPDYVYGDEGGADLDLRSMLIGYAIGVVLGVGLTLLLVLGR